MKIWKLSTSLESEQIAAANKEDDETLFKNLLQQGEYLHSKTNLPVETYEKGELNNLLTYKGFATPPIIDGYAVQSLEKLISEFVEFVPLTHPEYKCYAVNIVNVINECVNYSESIPDDFGGFDKLSFIEDKVKRQPIFRIKYTEHSLGDFPIISPEIYVSDAFREVVFENGLTGFTFYEVWSSQEAEASVEELNPFVRESLDEDVEAHLQAYYGPIIRRVEAESAEVTEAGFYEMAPTESVPFYTVATHGYSTLRLPAPPGLDSAYVELVMHADQDPFEDEKYSWIPQVMHQVGSFAVNNMNWIGQWMVFPNQELDRYVDTYERTLTGEKVKLPLQVQPYSPESGFCGVMVVPPLPQCQEAFMMPYLENGKETHGEWPVYFHTLLPLYEEEMEYYFQHGQEALLEKMMENGIEHLFNLHRPNTFKEKRKGFFGRFNK
ncbi:MULTISPECIES: suppressor of fused domain protein [Priestia]|uniref:suppressor of fused domain protein n=1 Tax=Priestia TaxID=2800373 RepID=UPI001CBC8E99|nr:suppressor of fused domain protein [Priestia aryabhattai]MCA1050270.1 suppressor of fused domain protein [Priestia aryabhattai]MED4022098.1 suppressor of fused domain protein [Priestia aryabhattai]